MSESDWHGAGWAAVGKATSTREGALAWMERSHSTVRISDNEWQLEENKLEN